MKHMNKSISLICMSAFILSACADDGQVYKDKTNKGVGIGAIAGAAAGLVLGDDRKDVVIGTIAGGIIGGVIGHSLDEQEQALRGDLSKDATIQNTGSSLIVTLPEDVTFDTNSTHISRNFKPELAKIAANLRKYPDTTVDVIGHTDNTGSESFNQALSADRAHAVTSILTQKGVNSHRIASYGRGETSPKATNDSEYGKAQNRRVEIIIRPEA